jgi:hypothetical protein
VSLAEGVGWLGLGVVGGVGLAVLAVAAGLAVFAAAARLAGWWRRRRTRPARRPFVVADGWRWAAAVQGRTERGRYRGVRRAPRRLAVGWSW